MTIVKKILTDPNFCTSLPTMSSVCNNLQWHENNRRSIDSQVIANIYTMDLEISSISNDASSRIQFFNLLFRRVRQEWSTSFATLFYNLNPISPETHGRFRGWEGRYDLSRRVTLREREIERDGQMERRIKRRWGRKEGQGRGGRGERAIEVVEISP